MVTDTVNNIRSWKFPFNGKLEDKDHSSDKKISRICWATQFKNLLSLNKQEQQLAPCASLTYCRGRPPTLGNQLTNYKTIAQGDITSTESLGSHPCNHCGLCGKHGSLNNMVLATEKLVLPGGKTIPIKARVTCKDQGVYAAKCLQCSQFYVGQTKNAFSTRWSSHRFNWNKMNKSGEEPKISKEDSLKDQNALFIHYRRYHPDKLHTNLLLSEAYRVIFIEKTAASKLDIRENYWIGKLDAKINISKTYLPKYK